MELRLMGLGRPIHRKTHCWHSHRRLLQGQSGTSVRPQSLAEAKYEREL